jgi:small multidrug resistance pump
VLFCFNKRILVAAGAIDMNPYVVLAGAILAELFGTTALKLSDGFSQLVPSLGVVVGYGLAFYLVSLTLKELPIGVVYGTWAALGIVGVAAIGVVVFDEPLDLAGIIGILLIVGGVYCVNVVSQTAAH